MKKLIRFLAVIYLFRSIYVQFTQQILFKEKKLVNDEQIVRKISYSKEISKKQYTIWGWFKISKDYPKNTNLISMKNLIKKEMEDGNGKIIESFEDGENLLFINFNKSGEQYNFSFNFKDNSETNYYFLKEVSEINLKFGNWNYIAISVNEKSKNQIFIDNFDGSEKTLIILDKQIIDYEINSNLEIILAENQNNNYNSLLKFSDTLGYFTFCDFSLINLESLWIYYINEEKLNYNAVLYNFIFDLYHEKQKLKNKTLNNFETPIKNPFTPIYTENKNKIGLKAKLSNEFTIKKVNFTNSDSIKPYIYYFHLKFTGNFPITFTLLSQNNTSNTSQIKLEIKSSKTLSKNISIAAKGLNKQINWQSTWGYENNKEYIFFIGIIISPSKNVRLVYQDNYNRASHVKLGANFDFGEGFGDILVLGNENFFGGFVEFYRFMILNSAVSPMYFKFRSESDLEFGKNDCVFFENGFGGEGCFACGETVLKRNGRCGSFCGEQEKNSGYGFCVACENLDCSEKDVTKFEVVADDSFDNIKLKTSRRIINPNFTLNNIFDISLNDKILEKENLTFNAQYNETENQYINYNFKFKKELKNEKLTFTFKDKNLNLYDKDRNLINTNPINFKINYFCYVKKTPKQIIKILAYISQIGFYLIFLLLIFLTIFQRSKIKDLITFWKYVLMMWVKLQVISVSYLFGINMPCTSGVFFSTLYEFNIKWHHSYFEKFFKSENYLSLLDSNRPINGVYVKEGIQAYLVENLFFVFVFHLIVVFIFGVLKITLFFNKKKVLRNFLDYFEFTGLFIFFLIFGFPLFYFSTISLYHTSFSHFSFVLSFFVSLLYLILFLIFIAFFYNKLYNTKYFQNRRNKKRFFIFFAGYRNIKKIHSFDIRIFLTQFLIAFSAAIFYQSPLLQTILIFTLQLTLIYLAKTYAPWIYPIINLNELISLILGSIGTIFAIVIASRKNSENPFIGDREGFYAFSIVITTFFSILISYFTFFYLIFIVRFYSETFEGVEVPRNLFVRGVKIRHSKEKIEAKFGKKKKTKENSFMGSKENEDIVFNNEKVKLMNLNEITPKTSRRIYNEDKKIIMDLKNNANLEKEIKKDNNIDKKDKKKENKKETKKEKKKEIKKNENKNKDDEIDNNKNDEEIQIKKNNLNKKAKINKIPKKKPELINKSINKIYETSTPPIKTKNKKESEKKEIRNLDFSDEDLDIVIPDSNLKKKVSFGSIKKKPDKHIKLQNYIMKDIDIDDIMNN